MVTVARTIGGPGGGKTRILLSKLEMALDRLACGPLGVGFVSFTRAARREASSRAALKFGMKERELEKEGWFRTLHSCAYRILGVASGELLTGTRDDNEWLKGLLGDDSARMTSRQENDDSLNFGSEVSEAGKCLAMWDCARNRQVPVRGVQAALDRVDSRTPDLDTVLYTVGAYEAGKAKAGRLDFCDMLMRFAGRQWTGNHDVPFADCPPDGEVPALPVWIGDEWQDTSALMALAFRRLTQDSVWAYLGGDFQQAIYGWSGADGTLFRDWPVAKEEELPVSYRCRSEVLAFADRILQRGGHAPRKFRAEHQGGQVVRSSLDAALASVKPGEDTLVLARTNELARQAADVLDDCLIPWKPIKGGGGYAAPARAGGVVALEKLRRGAMIDGEGYRRLLDLLPSKANGVTLFRSGTKKRYDDAECRRDVVAVALCHLDMVGATRECQELIGSGRYVGLLEAAAARMAICAKVHGVEAVSNPRARVGTIHAAKGLECDHCVLVDQIPYPTQLAIEEREGMAEERRLWYVGASRARHKLTVACGDGPSFPDL